MKQQDDRSVLVRKSFSPEHLDSVGEGDGLVGRLDGLSS